MGRIGSEKSDLMRFRLQCGRSLSVDMAKVNSLSAHTLALVIHDKATLTANSTTIPAGGSVTLTCDVKESADLEYEWFRQTSSNEKSIITNESGRAISVSEGGNYTCRAEGKNIIITESDSVTVQETVRNRITVKLQHSWSQIFTGETITLRCEIQGGEGKVWKYEWTAPNTNSPPTSSEYRISTVSVSHSGDYRCRGSSDYLLTGWSDAFRLTVSYKPRATLTAGTTIIPVGGSVTLSCSVQSSDGWKYEWFRRTQRTSEGQIRDQQNRDIRVSQGGIYSCRGTRGNPVYYTDISDDVTIEKTFSNKVVVKQQPNWPQIFRGETITLTCEVQEGGETTEWEYEWRGPRTPTQWTHNNDVTFRVSESSSGDYMCKSRRRDDSYSSTEWSEAFTLSGSSLNKPTVTLQPSWTQIYSGETVTVRCEIQGGDTEWDYEWETNSMIKAPNQNEYRIRSASSSNSGNYRCKGRMKSSQHKTTEWSDSVTLTVSDNKPRPVLTVSPSWLSPGASVTLNCEVEHPSAGWSFYWYKAVPDLSEKSSSYELLPDGSGTAQDSYIIHGQTHTAGYVCRAGRGDPEYHTDHSQPEFVWSADVHSAASLTVSPDRVQHFTSDSVSLTCEGNFTEWRVRKFSEDGRLYSDCRRMTGSTCNINTSKSDTAVYWCESGSGEFSSAVNITVQNDGNGPILVSPVHPVTEGASVSLSCSLRTQKILSNVFFYHNDKLIQNDTRGELKISAVSKSDEGFYKCQYSGRESAQSWMSVKVTVSTPESSSFSLLMIFRLILGFLFIFLPFFLFGFRCYKVDKPRATLTAGTTIIPVGGSVTLTCSVQSSDGWKYEWFRRTQRTSEVQIRDQQNRDIRVSQGGIYSCRGTRGNPVYYTDISDEVTIEKTFSNKVVVKQQPNWPQIFRGETITLTCEVQEGGETTEWEYEWRGPSTPTQWTHNNDVTFRVSESSSGDYMCKSRRRDDSYSSTEWSEAFTLSGSTSKPRATLTAQSSVIPAGGSVTLSCSMEGSAGWKFDWFRRDSVSSKAQLMRGNEANRVISVSQGGLYHCRGGRGDPVYYTEDSSDVTVTETFPSKPTVTLQPSWTQIYSGETVTVRCEIQGGEGAQWTYEWRAAKLNTPPTSNEHRIIRATESDSGGYSCRGRRDYFFSEWSDIITLTVSYKPKAKLRADNTAVPVGGSVTLTCSVNPSSSSGWKYYWYRDEKSSEALTTQDAVFHSNGQISVSQEGLYRCRGGRGNPVYYTEDSQSVRIGKTVTASNRPVVTLYPNWSEIYRGETITVRCEIHGGDTEWDYEWETNSRIKAPNQNEYRIRSASSSNSGNYRCKGRMKSSQHKTTEWSDSVTLTVSDNKPRPVLTVSPSWLSPGASVTLNCEVEHPSAGWSFYWYKAVPDLSEKSSSYELLPDGSGTAQDSYIIHGQTHTAGYVCRAGRGDPEYHTDHSQPKFVWSADVHSAASLTVSPDRVQHFTSDSVSLTCEGNFTEWRVRKFSEDGRLYSDCRRMTGSTCNINTSKSDTAVYWCESGSGEFSSAVNITVQNDGNGPILVSPVHPVTEGASVSLSCSLRTQKILSNVFFYHNDKLIQNDTRGELKISAVSKSDEGFYKCQYSGRESAQSWMSVKGEQDQNI
ncbi:unnamed protein product [Oreochromis niloticus]|nr:unnamed protein product [Mustela putorius furo]